jgi:Gpi18-like mannosyltransferase
MKKFWKKNKRAIKFILVLFVVFQTALFFLDWLSPKIIHRREGFNYVDPFRKNPDFLFNRANFDGIHYLSIAKNDYGLYQQAFFPLYPNLIRVLTPFFGGKDLVAGIFISVFCSLVFLFLFYKLVLLDYQESVARYSLIFLLFFPTSFFFGMVYTESLFLMLVLGCFLAARKGKWLMAGLLGAFASYTRLVGVFLFPAILYEWWQAKKSKNWKLEIRNFLFLCLIPAGLFKYMYFLWQKYNDPLMFFHVQPFFGAQRSGGKIILLYQVFWRYFKMILTTKWDLLYFTVWLEFLTALGMLTILFLAYKKGIRESYLVFAGLAFITPTITGTFSSLPRYALVLFPCFVWLGMMKNTIVQNLLVVISGTLFIISTLLFFQGYWIA